MSQSLQQTSQGEGLLIVSQSDTKAPHNSDLYRNTEHTNCNLVHAYWNTVTCLSMSQMLSGHESQNGCIETIIMSCKRKIFVTATEFDLIFKNVKVTLTDAFYSGS